MKIGFIKAIEIRDWFVAPTIRINGIEYDFEEVETPRIYISICFLCFRLCIYINTTRH